MTPHRDLSHALEIRAILRRTQPSGWGRCGCPTPQRHEDGCLDHLDRGHRDALHKQLLAHPLPRPRMSVDEEMEMLARIRSDRAYAALVLARFLDLLGEAS